MNTDTVTRLDDSSSSLTPEIAQTSGGVKYIETRVHGRDETGLTLLDEHGKGMFFPDSGTTIPGTAFTQESQQEINTNTISVDALYPQWEENRADVGSAVWLVTQALTDVQRAAEQSCSSNPEILNFLVLAETRLFQALQKSKFNKAFEIVVSFCAWSLKNAEFESNDSPSIQGMSAVLREIREKPFLGVDRATTLIMDLEDQGWKDESFISVAFREGAATLEKVAIVE